MDVEWSPEQLLVCTTFLLGLMAISDFPLTCNDNEELVRYQF